MTNVKLIGAEETWALRHRVLRPHQDVTAVQYAEDKREDPLHFGAFNAAGEILAIASVYHEDEKGLRDLGIWRLRGMASAPEVRGSGFGARVLQGCLQHLQGLGASQVWCNARVTVRGFYEKHGFVVEGDVFEMPGIGPHVFMRKRF